MPELARSSGLGGRYGMEREVGRGGMGVSTRRAISSSTRKSRSVP